MIYAKELKGWIRTLEDDDEVSIDEGGLTLITASGRELEVGGVPEEDPLTDENVDSET